MSGAQPYPRPPLRGATSIDAIIRLTPRVCAAGRVSLWRRISSVCDEGSCRAPKGGRDEDRGHKQDRGRSGQRGGPRIAGLPRGVSADDGRRDTPLLQDADAGLSGRQEGHDGAVDVSAAGQRGEVRTRPNVVAPLPTPK